MDPIWILLDLHMEMFCQFWCCSETRSLSTNVCMFRNKQLADNKFEESQLCILLNILLYELSMKTDDSNCFSLYFISAHLLLFSSREHSSRINVVILAFVYYNWLGFFHSITYPCYFDRKLENNRSNAFF